MEFVSLQSLLFFVSIILYLCLRSSYSRNKKPTSKSIFKFLGILPEFIKQRHRFLDWSTELLSQSPTNTVVFHRPGKIHGVITANPLNVEYMLKTNFENFPKGKRMLYLLQDFLGQGIFNADGELWKVQRKTASYEFNTKSLRNFVMENVAVEIKERLIPVLRNASMKNQVVDLQDILERFAFDNICKLAFNFDAHCLGDGGDKTLGKEFMRAFDDASTLSSERFMYAFETMFKVKKFLCIGSEKRLKKSVSIVHEFAESIIRSRLKNQSERKEQDLLSRFIGKEENSADFLRDIIISFMLAGRDTTSSALSYFFWLLSSRPRIKSKIINELKTIRARSNKNIGETYPFEEIRDMHYLHAAISESMRLYPPVPVDTKACLHDDILPDGTFIGAGWFATYNSYSMGRMESVWGKDCEEYLPERWLENGVYRPENPFRYPIFHAGPRMCLGKDMAYIQMKSVAAAMIERFDVDLSDKDKCPEHLMSLTLKMKGGLPVILRERNVGG